MLRLEQVRPQGDCLFCLTRQWTTAPKNESAAEAQRNQNQATQGWAAHHKYWVQCDFFRAGSHLRVNLAGPLSQFSLPSLLAYTLLAHALARMTK